MSTWGGTPAVNRACELYTQLEAALVMDIHIVTHDGGPFGVTRAASQALLPSEMPSFVQFAERYSYKELGKPSFGSSKRSVVFWEHFKFREIKSSKKLHVFYPPRTVYFTGRPTVKWNGAQRPAELNCWDSAVRKPEANVMYFNHESTWICGPVLVWLLWNQTSKMK